MTNTDAPATEAPTIATAILDDDAIGADLDINPAPKTSDTEKTVDPAKTEPVKETPPDADTAVLELSTRTRETVAAKKNFEAKTKELNDHIARHKEFDSVLALAKTDPLAFCERLADATGLELHTVIEAYNARKAGSDRQLTADEKIALLEKERATEKAEAEKRAAADKAKKDEDEGAAAVVVHVNAIKSLATAGKENFPLANLNIEEASNAAFDLMVLANQAGMEVPSYASALQQIEVALRDDAEKKAIALGYTKASSTPTTPAETPNALNVQPRQTVNGSAAPIVVTSQIKSDDEIADDWINMRSAR
jgi:hypothetical protein